MSSKSNHMKRSSRSFRTKDNGRIAFYRDAYNKTFDINKALAEVLSNSNAKVLDMPNNIDADGNVVDSTATEVVEESTDKE